MIINDNPTLQPAAETLYRLNMDERFREACERFAQAEIEHNGAIQRNIHLTQINEELAKTNEELAQTNEVLISENAAKDTKIAELTARLKLLEKTLDQ